MKLIVGLGNPKEKYNGTRHNVGYFTVSSFAVQKEVTLLEKNRFRALIGEYSQDNEKVIIALPTTYYNLSGEAVRSIVDFYRVPTKDVLIVHDELALPFGTLRARLGGSSAGNNGVKSVTEHMGPDTARLRIGIYNDLRDKMEDAEFVLGKFSKEETDQLAEISKKALDIIESFVSGSFEPSTLS